MITPMYHFCHHHVLLPSPCTVVITTNLISFRTTHCPCVTTMYLTRVVAMCHVLLRCAMYCWCVPCFVVAYHMYHVSFFVMHHYHAEPLPLPEPSPEITIVYQNHYVPDISQNRISQNQSTPNQDRTKTEPTQTMHMIYQII